MWTGERDLDQASAGLREYGFTLRRYAVVFSLYFAFWLGLGASYFLSVEPDFIATVELSLQPRVIISDLPLADQQVSSTTLNVEDAENELQLIRSRRLLLRVFTALRMDTAPELVDGHDGVWVAISNALHRFALDPIKRDPESQAFERFMNRIRARRLGRSFVIEIAYRSRDPQSAARVANAVTSAYLRDRIGRARADIEVTAPYLKDRMEGVVLQDGVAAEAMRKGTLPDHYLEHADVRPLGPSVVPRNRLFPKAVPVLVLCGGIGLVSGLLFVALLATLDQPLRTRRQLYRRLGLASLGPLETEGQRGTGALSSSQRWSETWKSVRAAVAIAEPASGAPVVGFAACRRCPESRAMVQAFADTLASDSERPLIADGGPAQEVEGMSLTGAQPLDQLIRERSRDRLLLVALPPLGGGAGGSDILPYLDAAILIVVARRTTCHDIMAAMHSLRTAGVALVGIVFDDGTRGLGS